MFQLLALALLVLGAYAQEAGNGTDPQKPTEEKQGGEYSGFNETGRQDQGLPDEKADPVPQAPITGVDVDEGVGTETADTFVEPVRGSNLPMLVGAGVSGAIAAGIAIWYFRSRSRASKAS